MDEGFIKDDVNSDSNDKEHYGARGGSYRDTSRKFQGNIIGPRLILQRDGETRKIKMLITFGWIFAALAAFIYPYFAIIGVTIGLIANRKVKGIGNYVIATNLVLGSVNLIFGFFSIIIKRLPVGIW